MENVNFKNFISDKEIKSFLELEIQDSKQAINRLSLFITQVNLIHTKVKNAVKVKKLDIGKASSLNYSKKLFRLALADAGCSQHFIDNNLKIAGNSKALEIFAGDTIEDTVKNIDKKDIETVQQLKETLKNLSPPVKAKVSSGKVKVKVSNSKELKAGISKQLINLDARHLKELRAEIDKLLATTTVKDATPVKNVA